MHTNCNQEKFRLAEELGVLRNDQATIERRIGEIEERLAFLEATEEESPAIDFQADEHMTETWLQSSCTEEAIRASEKLVTRGSALWDKYELFCKLFAGRPDVHAVL